MKRGKITKKLFYFDFANWAKHKEKLPYFETGGPAAGLYLKSLDKTYILVFLLFLQLVEQIFNILWFVI